MKALLDKARGLSALGVVVLYGCGGSKVVKENRASVKEAYEIQAPIQVRTSEDDSRPDWTRKGVFEESGKVYFSGGFMDGVDYAVTIRCANAEALKSAIQAVSQFIRAEFSSYVQGSNTFYGEGIERYVSDGIATFAENVHVQGIRQSEVYYEEMFSPAVMQPSYNVFVKLEMSKADYLHAKADVLRKLRDMVTGLFWKICLFRAGALS
jgi:hypothetical protein